MGTDEMAAMHDLGATYRTIAAAAGVSHITVFNRLRALRGAGPAPIDPPKAANDNIPGRKVVMAPHNGGCSTTSGMVPVTLAEAVAA